MATEKRYIGMDIHREFVVLIGINAEQEVVLSSKRVSTVELEPWVSQHLTNNDRVVMEATTNVWDLYDQIAPHVGEVKVAHPYRVKLISASMVKTDKRDALILARLLAANLIPDVWVPPHHVRELRSLTHHRRQLVKQRAMAKNRLRGILFRHNLVPPDGGLFAQTNRDWWKNAPLNSIERLRAKHDLANIDHFTTQIDEVEKELAQLSVSESWVSDVPFLLQMPGFGLVSVMTILAAIGTIDRFPAADQLVGYAGLGARVHNSGQTNRGGGITKQGRTELRTMMIEVAWRAVQNSPVWKARYQHLCKFKPKQQAITIIARRLLVAIWHILTKRQVDYNADPAAVARSFLRWASTHRLARSLGMKRIDFLEYALNQIGTSQLLPEPA